MNITQSSLSTLGIRVILCGLKVIKTIILSFFHQTVREMVVGHSSKAVMDSVVVNNASEDLAPLARTDARVFLLYSTHEEAKHILRKVRVAD